MVKNDKILSLICIKVLLLLHLLILIKSPIYATMSVDNLETVLKTATEKQRVDILLLISELERDKFPEKSHNYAKEALLLSDSIGYDKGIAESKIKIGIYYSMKSEYDSAITLFDNALAIYKNIDDKEGQGFALNALGRVFGFLGSYTVAEEYYKQSLEIKMKINNKYQIGITYMNLGELYRESQKYTLAYDYHIKSVEIFKELKDFENLGKEYNNIAIVYYETGDNSKALEFHKMSQTIKKQNGDFRGLGISLCNVANIYIEMNKNADAISNLNEALRIFNENHMLYEKNIALLNIGNAYSHIQNYQKAEYYYNQSVNLSDEIGDKPGIAFAKIKLAQMCMEMKKYEMAIRYCIEGSKIFHETGKFESYCEAKLLLAGAYKANHDYASAFSAIDEYLLARDSLHKVQNASLLGSLNRKYHAENKALLLKNENSLKESEIEKQKIIIFLLSAFLLILFIFFTMIIKMYKDLKAKKLMIEKANEILLHIDLELSKDLQADLFDLSCHMSNLKDNAENRLAIDKYKEFISKYNRLRKYIVADN